MSNNWFQFKQFRVVQDACAMKVTTDACIQGAWTPVPISGNILDIGTGTGLLSLMVAQRSSGAKITALEIDKDAAQQASANFEASTWRTSIDVQQADFMEWESAAKYDLIICNPPFFLNSLRSPEENRNMAKHTNELTLEGILQRCKAILKESGILSLLLPTDTYLMIEPLFAKQGLYEMARLEVRHKPDGRTNRIVTLLSPAARADKQVTQLHIYEADGVYSGEFKKLLRDYYLHL